MSICNFCYVQWREKRETIIEQSSTIVRTLIENVTVTMPEGAKLPTRDCVHQSFRQLHERFDAEYGGFGKAPKFPQPSKTMKA